MASSAYFLILSRTTCLEIALPKMGRTFLYRKWVEPSYINHCRENAQQAWSPITIVIAFSQLRFHPSKQCWPVSGWHLEIDWLASGVAGSYGKSILLFWDTIIYFFVCHVSKLAIQNLNEILFFFSLRWLRIFEHFKLLNSHDCFFWERYVRFSDSMFEFFVFLMFRFSNSLYILDSNPLSDE